MNEELYKIALYTIDRKYLHKNERIFIRSCIKTLYEENQQLEEEIRILKEHPFLSKEAFKKLKITMIEKEKGGSNE